MYKLSAVTKNYAKGRETVAALRGVDLVIEDGEWLAIQGPTGHGKSTLLQISEERRVGKECRSRWSPYQAQIGRAHV